MRIGLISDTHIPEVTNTLPTQLKDVFQDVDLIMHAGDIYTVSVLDELERLAPVIAAEGDDDYPDVHRDPRVKNRHIMSINGVTVWLTHIRPWSWPQRVKIPNVLVFGHTHLAKIEEYEGILLVNPGSATFPSYKRQLGTVAILTINSLGVNAHIVQLK